jgi:membrane protein DedA with SNARE-associated domain
MKWKQVDYFRFSSFVFVFIVLTIIASLTIGRNIYDNSAKSLLSFAILNFTGYLFFFLFMPVELAFIYFLRSGFDLLELNLVAVTTTMAAQSVDYLVGYFFSAAVIGKLIGKKKYEKAEEKILRYGSWTIFLANLLPLSSPVISLAAGMLKYRIRDALFYSLAGITLRYLILTLIF